MSDTLQQEGGPRLESLPLDGDPPQSQNQAHATLAGPHANFHARPPRDDAGPADQEEPLPHQACSVRERSLERLPSRRAGSQLTAADLWKTYRKGRVEVPVLRGVSLSVCEGELLAVVGQSGSGKSTLLHLLGTLDVPDDGEIRFGARRIDKLPAAARDALRNRHFGMIFQFYHLLPELSTLENVLAPLMITHGTWGYWRRRREYRARALELLNLVGLGHRLKHLPRELSGGEMQRAAIARSLVARPSLLLADEPTGNLDQGTGQEIIKILRDLNRRENLTIVMVTHDQAIAAQADRVVRLVDGQIALD